MIRALAAELSLLTGCLALQSPVLTLDEAVSLALRQNPNLEIARREQNVALIEADRNRPAFRPQLDAIATQIVRGPRVELPGVRDEVVLPNSISRLAVELRQPLYQFGAGRAPAARANAMAAAARSNFRKAELDTVLQVREGYEGVRRARALAGVARQALDLARANVELTRLLEERRLQATLDVLEAERAEAEAASGLLQAENGVRLAQANVNRLLGRDIETPFETAPDGELPGEPGPLQELVAQAMQERPEAQTLRHNIEAAEAGLRLAKASRLPRVDLEAAYELQTETALVPESGVSAGITVRAPIFDGPVRRFTIREAEERVEQLRSSLAALEGGIALEIERQRLAMGEARQRIELADRAVRAAEQAYEITRARQERGFAIQAEVQRAQLALRQARTDRATAESDLRLARMRLDRAIGK